MGTLDSHPETNDMKFICHGYKLRYVTTRSIDDPTQRSTSAVIQTQALSCRKGRASACRQRLTKAARPPHAGSDVVDAEEAARDRVRSHAKASSRASNCAIQRKKKRPPPHLTDQFRNQHPCLSLPVHAASSIIQDAVRKLNHKLSGVQDPREKI